MLGVHEGTPRSVFSLEEGARTLARQEWAVGHKRKATLERSVTAFLRPHVARKRDSDRAARIRAPTCQQPAEFRQRAMQSDPPSTGISRCATCRGGFGARAGNQGLLGNRRKVRAARGELGSRALEHAGSFDHVSA